MIFSWDLLHIKRDLLHFQDTEGSDVFINAKTLDDFKVLDKHYIYTLNVSATKQLHKIEIEPKNETNGLKIRLARSVSIGNSSSIVDGTTHNGTDAKKK